MTSGDSRIDLLGCPRTDLKELLAPWVDREYRVDQVFRAIHAEGVERVEDITTLSKELRSRLAERFRVGLLETVEHQLSEDGTAKYLFRLVDGATIETVDIPVAKRRTVCLSSQAGCALACSFCVTGYWGAGRDLTAGEIVGQVRTIFASNRAPAPRLNLVFMGMGEPLHNLDEVRRALEILTQEISWRRVTISTAGVVPGIQQIGNWTHRPNLALSLHAPDDERRGQLMPINTTYPIAALLDALKKFPLSRGRRHTIEYLLIRDFNDARQDADALGALLRGLKAKVNLIPVNPDSVLDDRMVPPSSERVEAFSNRLRSLGLVSTIRRQRGDDVSAACGQLRAPGRTPRGFRRSNLNF